jgi:hypothetical protein
MVGLDEISASADNIRRASDKQELASRKGKPIDAYTVAQIYSALDEKDEAFKWLEKTYQDHLSTIWQLKVDPFMDNIRSDPRFKDYLKKAGFEFQQVPED